MRPGPGHEAGPTAPPRQERLGVEIAVPVASGQVQTGVGPTDPVAGGHDVVTRDRCRPEWADGRAEAARVLDHHPAATADRAGEGDRATGDRHHRLTAGGVELQTSIPGPEAVGRGAEPIDDPGFDRGEPPTPLGRNGRR